MANQPQTPTERGFDEGHVPKEQSVRRAIEAFKLPAYTVDEAVAKYENREFRINFMADIRNVALAFDAQDQLWQARVDAARVEAVGECVKECDEEIERLSEQPCQGHIQAAMMAEAQDALVTVREAIRSLLTSPQPAK